MSGLNTEVLERLILAVLYTTLGPVMVVVPLSTEPFVALIVALPKRLTVLFAVVALSAPAVIVPPAPAPPAVKVPLVIARLTCTLRVPPGWIVIIPPFTNVAL